MKIYQRVLILAALSGLVASTVAAERGSGGQRGARNDRGERWDAMVSRLDADKDGRISRSEFLAKHAGLDRVDRNDDGVADKDEIAAATVKRPRLARLVERVDENRDGEITLAEVTSQRATAFDKRDSGHDGYLDESEFLAR